MLRYLTGGESHGKCLVVILDGVPAGLLMDKGGIDKELARRMAGFGRGRRMSIESDRVEILSGIRRGRTIGSPVTMMVKNLDASIEKMPVVLEPRPGHADLAGSLKYGAADIRDVLERASGRETAARVCAGAVAKMLLGKFGIGMLSHVTVIGGVSSDYGGLSYKEIMELARRSPVRCADCRASDAMIREIEKAASRGDTLGGAFEVLVTGVPPGLGSYAQWDLKLDARLARAMISIQAVKAVGFGMGFEAAMRSGSEVHDEIFYDRKKGFFRKTNNAGGIEGGMSNGEPIVIRAVMKPISTLKKPLASVNIRTKKQVRAAIERSDTCAVPAAGVVGEAVTAIEIADAFLDKFGGDSISEIERNYRGYLKQVEKF